MPASIGPLPSRAQRRPVWPRHAQRRPARELVGGEQAARLLAPGFALALEDGRQLVALDHLGGEDLERERPLAQGVDEVIEEAGVALGRGEAVEGRGVVAEQVGHARPESAAPAPFAQQFGKAAEVAVDQHLVDAGFLGDGVDADGAEAIAGEHDADRAEDAGLGRLAVARRSLGRGRRRQRRRRTARARRPDPGCGGHRPILSAR